MKILHVTSAITWRGGENQIHLLIRGLLELGVENFILCPALSEISNRVADSIAHKTTYKKRSGVSITVAMLIKRISARQSIDIIHVHDSHSHSNALMSFLIGNKTPILITRRVDFRIKALSILKYNFRGIKKIICVSHAVKKVLKRDGVKSNKLATIYSGTDLEVLEGNENLKKALGIFNKQKVVGFIGAFVEHKDPLTFVKMAAILSKHDESYVFLMAGQKGKLTEMVERQIKSEGLVNRVTILGFVNDMDRLWNTLDVLVVTSKEEGLGTVVLDAFKFGIPVVCTTAGGLPELVQNEKTGLLSPIGDYNDLSKNVQRVLSDKKLSQNLCVQSKRVLKKYDYKLMSKAYLDHYTSILQ